MLLLVATSALIDIVSTAALALDVHASYVDNASGTITPGTKNTAISTATTTTVVASPAAATQRNVQTLVARNKGGGAQGVTVRHNDGTTTVELCKATLQQDEVLEYLDGVGFRVLDATGAEKVNQSGSGQYLQTQVVTATGNVTAHPRAKLWRVRLQGAGGAGGGGTTVASGGGVGGGGGAGAYLEKSIAVTGGTQYAATIGAAGTGAAGAVGGNGGNTSLVIGATTYTAPGGTGGPAMAAGTTAASVLGGAGGAVATNGDLNTGGSPGEMGFRASGTVGQSGAGGDAVLGGGANGINAQGAGTAATSKGAGGGGAVTLNAGATTAGGSGGAGLIIVDEYT